MKSDPLWTKLVHFCNFKKIKRRTLYNTRDLINNKRWALFRDKNIFQSNRENRIRERKKRKTRKKQIAKKNRESASDFARNPYTHKSAYRTLRLFFLSLKTNFSFYPFISAPFAHFRLLYICSRFCRTRIFLP